MLKIVANPALAIPLAHVDLPHPSPQFLNHRRLGRHIYYFSYFFVSYKMFILWFLQIQKIFWIRILPRRKKFLIFLYIPVDRLAQFATREDTPGIPEEIQLFQIFSDEISSIIRWGYTRGDPALPDLLRWDIQHHQVRVLPEVIQLFQIFSESNEISSIIMCISWSVSLTMYHLPRNYSYSTVQCTCCRFCFAVSMFFLFLGLDRRCRQRTLFLLRCPSSTWPTSATVIGWTW